MAATQQATEAQTGFIQRLIQERDTDRLTELQRTWLDSKDFSTLTRAGASTVITALCGLPKVTLAQKAATQGGPEGVPNGRYAIHDPRDDVLKFYKVNSPTDGNWAGWMFVEVQASDEFHPIRDRNHRAQILAVINEDVKGAMLRYGIEIGCCGHCGRTLTNELSRELGIGPICRGKMGW